MTIHIVARHIKLTTAIKKFTEKKLEKLKHYFDNIIWAQAILTVEKKLHRAEIVLHAGKQTLRSQSEGSNLYNTITNAIDKMEVQVKKYKEKNGKNKRHKKNIKPTRQLQVPVSVDRGITLSVTKQVPLAPMSSQTAAMEMDKLGYTFWLFLDKETKQTNVIFKRQDNSYGLLQPVKRRAAKNVKSN